MKTVKLSVMKLVLTLALLSVIISGCVTSQAMPQKPTKPTLEIVTNPDDPQGICLDAENTYLLLDYIWRLEEGY